MQRSITCLFVSLFLNLTLLAATVAAKDIDFTRYLGNSANAQARFSGTNGAGRLLVKGMTADAPLVIELNGRQVLGADSVIDNGQVEVALSLASDNRIEVRSGVAVQPGLEIRVKQVAQVQLHVGARVHFNTNVSNFGEAREFYGKLGFDTLSGFPDTNTRAMAKAIGIYEATSYDGSQGEEAGGYLLHGELIGVNGYEGGLIDLIEFTIPKNDAAPFQQLNRLGMARAAMLTANLDADYKTLKAAGVNFLSPPAVRSDGTKFVVFTDLDGTFYELIEAANAEAASGPTQIVGLGQLVINVSDFDRSLAWYQMLGYELVSSLPATDSAEVAAAMGFAEPYEIRGGLLKHPEDDSLVELVQWLSPFDPQPPYPLPVNHLGIHRTAFYTSDIATDVAALKAQGVSFVSEVTPCCSGPDSPGSIVAFFDPDGTVVELVEQPFMMEGLSVLGWFRETFFN